MDNLNIDALRALPPEYLAEDRGGDLFRVSVAFIALETVFISLFLIARGTNKTIRSPEALYLMPAAYIFCVSVAIVGICE
jgi:hydrogenase-4 membrane subunit HyfE